jgi:hypothetical protein
MLENIGLGDSVTVMVTRANGPIPYLILGLIGAGILYFVIAKLREGWK